jgi:hypothetical protein
MFSGRAKQIRIVGFPDNQLPDNWSFGYTASGLLEFRVTSFLIIGVPNNSLPDY